MNEEESSRCIEISKQKLKDNNREAALKFALKAVALNQSSTKAKAWLVTVETSKANPETRKRADPADAAPTQPRPFTTEQTTSITQILTAKKKGDLYAILSLEKQCSDAEVKKAYRKLALRLHPDKCSAPKTDEAFKAISHAFKVLSDDGKRRNYDVNGIDEEAGRGGQQQQQSNMFGGMHNMHNMNGMDGFNAEDLFSAFFNSQFGAGMNANMNGAHFQFGGTPRNRRRQPQQQEYRQEEPQERGFAHYLPVLLIFGFSILTSIASLFGDSMTPYSFQQSNTYSMPRTTKNKQVKYFVNRKETSLDNSGYQPTLRKLERAIETDYGHQIREACIQERDYQRNMIRQAHGFFSVDQDKLKAAKAIELRSCAELSRIGS